MKNKIQKKQSTSLVSLQEKKKEEHIGNIIFTKTNYLNSKSRHILREQKFRILEKPGSKIKNIFNDHKKLNQVDPFDLPGIYKIKCDKCTKSYIGQTYRTIEVRSMEHLHSVNMGGGNYRKSWQDIQKKSKEDSCGFLKHIADNTHSTDFSQVQVLENTSKDTLDIKETEYIKKESIENLMNLKQGPLYNTSTFNLYMELKSQGKSKPTHQ